MLTVAALLAVAAIVAGVTSCHGHVVRAVNLPGDTAFDFKKPPCRPADRPEVKEGEIRLRYLAVAGLFVEWREVALLTAPYFTNDGLWRVAFGKVDPDEDAIAKGMAGLPDTPIEAVLVGHSHYDHTGDLPVVLPDYAPRATVYLNTSGVRMLDGDPDIDNVFVDVTPLAGTWIRPRDADGNELPLRLMPLLSDHAPQSRFFNFAQGEVQHDWKGLEGHRLKKMKGGQAFAYLIDLLNEDGSIAFRIHYQDAASRAPLGIPPEEIARERATDLAVVCMPSSWLAPGYPTELLDRIDARHVLFTHYEDFFRSRDKPLRFAPLLTNDRANHVIAEVRETLSSHTTVGPAAPVCGPGDRGWTMPLPGEWLRFATEPTRVTIDGP